MRTFTAGGGRPQEWFIMLRLLLFQYLNTAIAAWMYATADCLVAASETAAHTIRALRSNSAH
jgi:hypothetical protein